MEDFLDRVVGEAAPFFFTAIGEATELFVVDFLILAAFLGGASAGLAVEEGSFSSSESTFFEGDISFLGYCVTLILK